MTSKTLFKKILIANRGEIACRILRTAQRLGIRCVAVYSDADAHALHVARADEAYYIGPAPSRESYLNIAAIIEVAKTCGAEAIHPGYGFLSENAAFAEACTTANICFIGPPVSAIRAMGSKSIAKQLMEKAGVPLVPGYHGDAQDLATLQTAADKIGYPVLLKAAAGGGGKGMRIVEHADQFPLAVSSAQREAKSSFGDDTLLIEKYLTHPRHVEIQLFADQQGHYVHLFERDCSLQRRHQKVIEEAPAPQLSETTRRAMGEAAIAAARAINYVGAGTIEFLLDQDGAFYFMEMNTRLQVEHPITEMITQQDLVEWQLRVACGQALPMTQELMVSHGHAFEARIYAENPDEDFLPTTGKLTALHFPGTTQNIRVDTGIQAGDRITIFYDPLLAKLIVWGPSRPAALQTLKEALAQTHVSGLTTNLAFLEQLISHPDFENEQLSTHFIGDHLHDLLPETIDIPDRLLAIASLYTLLTQHPGGILTATSPWYRSDQFRNLLPHTQHLTWLHRDTAFTVSVEAINQDHIVRCPHSVLSCKNAILRTPQQLQVEINGEIHLAHVVLDDQTLYINAFNHRYALHRYCQSDTESIDSVGHLRAPMPGTVIAVLAQSGDHVKRGAGLLIMEAMKMEHTLRAPVDGVIQALHVKTGHLVSEGDELVVFEPAI